MDKSWMRAIKWSKAYIDGVNSFMKFVETHVGQDSDIRCPCIDCLNLIMRFQKTVKHHLLERGIDPGYITWFYHGEPRLNNFGSPRTNEDERNDTMEENDEEDDGVNDMLFDLGVQYHKKDSDNRSADDNSNSETGEVCDRIELYKRTHCTETGEWRSDEAEKNWVLMVEKREQYRIEGVEKTDAEIVLEVLGHRSGYIKGLGYGPKPPTRRNTSIDSTSQQLQKELQETQEKLQQSETQVNELKTQVTGFENEVNVLKNQLSQNSATVNKLMAYLASTGVQL